MASHEEPSEGIEDIDILNNIQIPVFVVDIDGSLYFLNRSVSDFFGKEGVELIGKTMFDLFPNQIATNKMKTIRKAINENRSFQSFSKFRIKGKTRWFENNFSPLNEGNEEIEKAIVVIIDVTDRMEVLGSSEKDNLNNTHINDDMLFRSIKYSGMKADIQSELIGKNAVIEDLNDVLKLINKILRHDLSNFLHFISGSLTLHKMKNDEESLNNAEFYVQKCYELIDNMRSLEEVMINDNEGEPVEIGPVIEKYVQKFPIDIEVQGDCCCEISRSFTSVMDNIINNAVKHGHAEKMRIEINSIDDEKCQIKFIDFGKGVPEDIRNIVFKEGFSYGDTKGTGLGLFIVKKLVERSGGKIWIEDNEPTGAVFVIEKDATCTSKE